MQAVRTEQMPQATRLNSLKLFKPTQAMDKVITAHERLQGQPRRPVFWLYKCPAQHHSRNAWSSV
jgi:hypothetical protein